MVRVLWRDAHFDYEEADPHPDYLVVTLGFVVSSGPAFLSIAAERLPDGGHRAVTHIPLESVVEGPTELTEA